MHMLQFSFSAGLSPTHSSHQFIAPIHQHFFQVSPLIFLYNLFLHAPLPFLSHSSLLPFILTAVCPFSVLAALKHLALISGMTGSLLVSSSSNTYFTCSLPLFISVLFSTG
ncbi:hypothetical protein ILYODFUR_032930 [Ilyodon furcidens]|uniref:Uncharacterized protein n=1 Tax=Ilyodon furcidens TaxID=33524 RepID=A0ABV0V863_9TELE